MTPLTSTVRSRHGVAATVQQLATSNPLRLSRTLAVPTKPSPFFTRRSNSTQAVGAQRHNEAPVAAVPPLARTNPNLYASLLLPPTSQLRAILARLHLPLHDANVLALLSNALVHPTWLGQRDEALKPNNREALGPRLLESLQQHESSHKLHQSHAELATLGNTLLGCLAAESLHLTYPNLPVRAFKAAVSSYVGANSLADVGVELGLGAKGVVKRNQNARVQKKDGKYRELTSREVLADVVKAVVAIIFKVKGMAATRNFIVAHLLSRIPLPPPHLPPASASSPSSSSLIAPLLKIENPKQQLSKYCQKHALEAPQSRLIAETGRLSNSAVFGVGVYSGSRRLGEGWGSSIAMAEHRAAEDALRKVLLAKSKDLEQNEIPSATLDEAFPGLDPAEIREHNATRSTKLDRNIWDVGADGSDATPQAVPLQAFRPRPLGEGEVAFGNRA